MWPLVGETSKGECNIVDGSFGRGQKCSTRHHQATKLEHPCSLCSDFIRIGGKAFCKINERFNSGKDRRCKNRSHNGQECAVCYSGKSNLLKKDVEELPRVGLGS